MIDITTVAKIVAVAIASSGVKIEVFCVSFEVEEDCENSTEVYWHVVGVGPCPSIPPVTKKGSMRKCVLRSIALGALPLPHKKDKTGAVAGI